MRQNTEIDNSKLEEITRREVTPKMLMELFDELKDAQFYLPVDFGPFAFPDIENSKPGDVIEGPEGFSINYLEDTNGNRIVPLFTSSEIMENAGVRTSVMVMHTSDLADMLKQTDKYSAIAINPLTGFDLNIPIEKFLSLFDVTDEALEALQGILKMLGENPSNSRRTTCSI